MNDPIFAKITFNRPRSGREIQQLVTSMMHNKWHPARGGEVVEDLDSDFGNFMLGQWARNEYDNVIVMPSADGQIFNRHSRYAEIFVSPHIWYENVVDRKEYPFHTTEDQLIAGVNNFARELVLDDAGVTIAEVPFRYGVSVSASH